MMVPVLNKIPTVSDIAYIFTEMLGYFNCEEYRKIILRKIKALETIRISYLMGDKSFKLNNYTILPRLLEKY